MKKAAALGLLLLLLALDSCRPPRKVIRKARETHRSAATRPLSPPGERASVRGQRHLDLR